jgi:dTDP-4-amino-4,6-dideoxygalactose transaminase
MCIDSDLVKKAITKKTAVILPVHFGGMPCQLDNLKEICRQHNLTLIEDAAHAAGAMFCNKKIGTHSDAVCFSFHPVKNLAMPTGGAITLNGIDSGMHENTCKIRRWCGISDRVGAKYDVSDLGWNFYMNEFSAAIGIQQLKKLDIMNKRKYEIAQMYDEGISLDNKMPFVDGCSYHLYWILVKNRDKFMKKMEDYGVETGIHYMPIHKMSYYDSQKTLKVTEHIAKQIVSIPIHPNLSNSDVNKIITLVNKIS